METASRASRAEPPAELPPAVPADALAAPSRTDALVADWFAHHFHGLGPQLPEALYNRFVAARDDLAARLNAAAP